MRPKSNSPKRSEWTWRQGVGLLAVLAAIGLHDDLVKAQQIPLPFGNSQNAWGQSNQVPPPVSVSIASDSASLNDARATSSRALPISGFGYSNWNTSSEAAASGVSASKTQPVPMIPAQTQAANSQPIKTLPTIAESNAAQNASSPADQSNFFNIVTSPKRQIQSTLPAPQQTSVSQGSSALPTKSQPIVRVAEEPRGSNTNFFNVVTRPAGKSSPSREPTSALNSQPSLNAFHLVTATPTKVAESNSSIQKTSLSNDDFFDSVTKESSQPIKPTSLSEPDRLQPIPSSHTPVPQGNERPRQNVKSQYNFFNVVSNSPAGSASQNYPPNGMGGPNSNFSNSMQSPTQDASLVSMHSAQRTAPPPVNFFNVVTPSTNAMPRGNRGNSQLETNDYHQSVSFALQDQVVEGERQASSNLADSETRLGTEPPSNELVFLRRQTVLLAQGQTQFDTGFFYSHLDDDRPVAALSGGNVVGVVEARTRQRLLATPFEIRYGFTDRIQLFANTIVGWSNSELAFNTFSQTQDIGGIGDSRFGMSMLLKAGQCDTPDIVFSLGATAPTGNDSFITANLIPNAQLGQGFWSLFGNLLFVHTWDPIVVYYGFGYNHRFDETFLGIDVDPGEEFDYQLGVGFAVNSNVSLSASFQGAYLTQFLVNGDLIEGSTLEPMRARLAVTVARNCRIWEPFAEIPMTDDAAARVGMTWTF